jgi:hypothetical protein
MTVKPVEPRRTRPVTFCIDIDADELLRAMAPRAVGIGRLLSELVRKEARERERRAQTLATLRQQAAVQEEVLQASAAVLEEVLRGLG